MKTRRPRAWHRTDLEPPPCAFWCVLRFLGVRFLGVLASGVCLFGGFYEGFGLGSCIKIVT